MTPSPEVIHELRAARPAAPAALRVQVREIAAAETQRTSVWRHLPPRRSLVVVLPAAAALALATAGAIGLARSGSSPEALRQKGAAAESVTAAPSAPAVGGARAPVPGSGAATDRAQQVSATLTVRVPNPDAVSKAAQDALELTRSLGGYVVSSSVSTGNAGSASLTVRVPVGRVQEAIVGLSGLGRIVSQEVNVQDLQESLDNLERRETTVRTQIARVRARLASESLGPEEEAVLRTRLQTLRRELVELRTQIASTSAEARMSTIQLAIVTPGSYGGVVPHSRIDRTIDGALNVLAWEGIVLLGLAIVIAPLAIAGSAVWFGRRLYRRREAERLLAIP